MIVAYCFHPKDEELALKNAQWITELGGAKGHSIFMFADARCGLTEQITAELHKSFDSVDLKIAGAEIDGWPEGANYFFRLVSGYLQSRRDCPYFFWMEPDAIPLREGWLDAIEAEHRRGNRPFTGARVEVKLEGKDVPLHMSGVGIYPNPLHRYAGEAYRAHEIAWDMAGKDQIVPKANFTKLIEHAWKHPQFSEISELTTQISPEAVLFHSSKDGSLINLLRSKRGRNHQKESNAPDSPSPATLSGCCERKTGVPSEAETKSGTLCSSRDDPATAQNFTCDIFIRTYPRDYPWLAYCLQAIAKFCTGFRKIVVVSPSPNPFAGFIDPSFFEWKETQDETEDGYLAQQITKMYADVILDYQPDYILHVDSDVIFTRPCTPIDFLSLNDKGQFQPIWYYTPYSEIQTPWQPITEKFMQDKIPYEFMRRFPILVPRWLYPRIREFCHKRHEMIISQYIRNQPLRAFSEFNALGAYAWMYHKEMFYFQNTLEVEIPAPVAKQYHSWGGLTDSIKSEIEQNLRGGQEESRQPHKLEIAGSIPAPAKDFPAVPVLANALPDAADGLNACGMESGGEARESTQADLVRHEATAMPRATDSRGGRETPPEGVKELPSGIWVLENDTHVSKWVEQEGRLDHDQNTLPFIMPHIKRGDVVVDCGAFIGDHTIAYSNAVGELGTVYAFEPNPLPFQCLIHNMRERRNVQCFNLGLGDKTETVPLSGNNGNAAGSYVGEHMKVADVEIVPLDKMKFLRSPSLIKIDAEGYDLRVLRGAKKLIEQCRPILVIEINYTAMGRQGDKVGWIYDWLDRHNYNYRIMQENCGRTSPMYDIICFPAGKLNPQGFCCSSSCAPPDSLISDEQKMKESVRFLKEFADKSRGNRVKVGMQLSREGLKGRKR